MQSALSESKRSPLAAAYPADRAAALAGVPRSTLYHWARTGLVVPQVSASKIKRWSFSDLLLLRLVEWLRKDKPETNLPRSRMREVRTALSFAEDLGDQLRSQRVRVFVDKGGGLRFQGGGEMFVPLGRNLAQSAMGWEVDLVDVFEAFPGIVGPDLAAPRPTLRIIPGKLSGEPHVEGTRVPTNVLDALRQRDYDVERIAELYPDVSQEGIREALDLEEQLHRNLGHAA
jgi:uncharacterized protein (DUF433 family)